MQRKGLPLGIFLFTVPVVIGLTLFWLSPLSPGAGASDHGPDPSAADLPQQVLVPVHFWVSNQSLGTDIESVQMTVRVDGSPIFDQPMSVGAQHVIAIVDAQVSEGAHTVQVEAGGPNPASASLVLAITAESWIYGRYWYDPQSAHENQLTPTVTIDVFAEEPGIK